MISQDEIYKTVVNYVENHDMTYLEAINKALTIADLLIVELSTREISKDSSVCIKSTIEAFDNYRQYIYVGLTEKQEEAINAHFTNKNTPEGYIFASNTRQYKYINDRWLLIVKTDFFERYKTNPRACVYCLDDGFEYMYDQSGWGRVYQ